jgi:hypothetical protein
MGRITYGVSVGRKLGMKVFVKVGKQQEEKHVNPDTKVKIKSTGEIGYVVKVDEDGFVCLRVPSTNGWPFPHYVFLPRNQMQVVKRDKNHDLQDVEEAPF